MPGSASPGLRLLVIAAYSIGLLLAGALVHHELQEADIPAKIWNRIIYARQYMAAITRAKPQTLKIDVAHKHYMRLAYTREQALARGKLVSSPEDLVPARITHNGKVYRVKLRLKGDLKDHWEDEHKWSFRIRVRGDETLLGMKQFSVQDPKTRGYLNEWVAHRALRDVDNPALRYDFIRLIVNGRDLGIYALEEHFDKHLIENSRRREGPIVRFNEDLCFAEINRGLGSGRDMPCGLTGAGSFLAADPDAFHTNKHLGDPVMAEQFLKAMHLLEMFRNGSLSTHQVFDVDKMARFFAIVELIGSLHMANWRNIRFYYNPVTSRLEPIGFDGGAGRLHVPLLAPLVGQIMNPDRNHGYYYHLEFFDRLFRDEVFFSAYIRELESVTAPGYLEKFLEEISDELQEKLWILHSEKPSYSYSPRRYYQNRLYIRSILNGPKAIHAYLESRNNGRIDLGIGNLQYLPIEIIDLRHAETGTLLATSGRLYPGRKARLPVSYETVSFELQGSGSQEPVDTGKLKVSYRIPGSSIIRQAEVFPWGQPVEGEIAADIMRSEGNVETFEFLAVDDENREIRVSKGKWTIDHDMVIPAGFHFRIGAGTTLTLADSVVLLSFSPVELLGRTDDPVVIRTNEGSGQGVIVIGADEGSLLEHVHFERLGEPRRNGWRSTGAVTFYESPVVLGDCSFFSNQAEDALNIVRSDFDIYNCQFGDSMSDALDVDFSAGKIRDTVFQTTGNDAVDISGSSVNINGLRVTGAGDKGLSAGEGSMLNAKDVEINDVRIAVASKDLSMVTIQDIRINRATYGFTAFKKKSEFGPGLIYVANNLDMKSTDTPYLIETGSEVWVGHDPIGTTQDNVRDVLY